MCSPPVFLASDIHLGVASPEQEAAFQRWLEFAAERAGTIFLNGDLFDFWFEWGSVIPRGYTRTLGTLARVVDSGVAVHLMGGNHDWWGGSYLTDEVGVTFHRYPVRLELAGLQALLAHGDGLGGGDLGYRILRGVLRSYPARWAFRWMHPDIATAVARGVSRTDGRRPLDEEGHQRRSDLLERWARDRLLEDDGLDLVVLGHTHLARKVEVAPGRFYLNTGDWLYDTTFAVLDRDRRPSLRRWAGG